MYPLGLESRDKRAKFTLVSLPLLSAEDGRGRRGKFRAVPIGLMCGLPCHPRLGGCVSDLDTTIDRHLSRYSLPNGSFIGNVRHYTRHGWSQRNEKQERIAGTGRGLSPTIPP